MNEISIDKAIKKGHRMINRPMLIICCITFVTFLSLNSFFEKHLITGLLFVILMLFSMILFPFIYRGFVLPKWKIWAFKNVRNVHELKKRAIQEDLLFEKQNIFTKIEFLSKKEKSEWKLIELKFDKEDIFIDVPTIPQETIIYFSKKKNIGAIIIMSICIWLSITVIIASKLEFTTIILALLFLVIGLYFGYDYFKFFLNSKPQIILTKEGIKTVSTKFEKWENVENEKVINEGKGKKPNFYLTYKYQNGTEKLRINRLTTNQAKLEKLMQIYRGRNNYCQHRV
jgi:hypothetical protein